MLNGFIRSNPKIPLIRRFVHASGVQREKAKVGYGAIEPILDFKHRFEHPENLEKNLKRRGQSDQFNVQDLCAQWKLYDPLVSKIQSLEHEKWKLNKQLKEVKKAKQADEIQKCGLQLKLIREDLRDLNENLAGFQEKFIKRFLSLPNDVHESTPDDLKVIFDYGRNGPAAGKSIHHSNYADAIEYHNRINYYLKGAAAKFDHTFTQYCLDHLRQNNFIEFSNPDFVQIPILEAIAATHDDFYAVSENLSDPTKLIYLAGNSSLHSFMGFIARLRVHGTLLPLKWMASGRIYKREDTHADASLFDVCQSNVVHIFQAGTEQQMLHQFQETIKLMYNLYEKLDMHFRIVYAPANELSNAESLVAKVEMFSPSLQRYIEVGKLCYYTDYISKRLLFSYIKDREKNTVGLMHIVSGTVCNLTKIVAIILETFNGDVPQKLVEINADKN